ncbi:MAG: ParB/RepB/Spo0J family partition protein [Nitrospiria bacterium]
MQKKALGRGLEALLPENFLATLGGGMIQEIELDRIIPNRYQPRKGFDPDGLKELANSIRAKGVMEPVLVRRLERDQYELIAGERRWRAAGLAGQTRIPAIVKEATGSEPLELALIENLLRKDLNSMEAARAYQMLIQEFHLTQDEIAQRVGKDRSSVANCLRLLNLPEALQADLLADRITPGHAKAILSLQHVSDQVRIGRQIVKSRLSVRETEDLVRKIGKKATPRRAVSRQTAEGIQIQEQLCYRLGTKVRMMGGHQRGHIMIEYYTAEDLDRILEIILH